MMLQRRASDTTLLPRAAGLLAAIAMSGWAESASADHPRLLLTPTDAQLIAESLDESPSYARALRAKQIEIDRYFASPPDVPKPRDPGGGYTHERHKKNGVAINDAGVLYQLTGERVYADRAKQLLLAYAEMYPGLGEHPVQASQTPGRLFWQNLNESVWLVYAIQGYDAIHDALSDEDRAHIESNLLRPLADFLSVGSPQTFDRIHNHGTWAVAAVGMTGYVLDDATYVERALHGLEGDGSGGFMRQLDELFSPDGYYTEGPYYQRYALMPFVVFARSIETNDPDLAIFEYRDSILLKAIYGCIDLSYAGLFFPINDAIKDKGLGTVELRYGLSIAYGLTGDPGLVSVADLQDTYVLTGDGFRLARARDLGEVEPYVYRSRFFGDGPQGERGALAVLRSGGTADSQALVLKATSQGMGHGHFDKLGLLFYDNGHEILPDYGAVRFLNVEQKEGGRYLPENTTWAKQTVAHNTLVVDEGSHFEGKLSVAERLNPRPLLFASNDHIQITAAEMRGPYDDVSFNRTAALVHGIVGDHSVVVDVLNATGSGRHQYDLPVHYNGQIVDVSHALESHTTNLRPLGDANGYQHLWLRARSRVAAGEHFHVTWLTDNRFYTYTMIALDDMEVLFAELGANDPDFNLRRERAMIFRVRGADDHSFISVLEPHGEYNGTEEFTVDSRGRISEIRHHRAGQADALSFRSLSGAGHTLTFSYDPDNDAAHSMDVGDNTYSWNGYFGLFRD